MALKSQDIKNGTVIRVDGKLQVVVEFLHVKPGKGNTFMRTKLKDVVSGYVVEKRFNIGEVLEDVRVERRPYQFLYMDGEDAGQLPIHLRPREAEHRRDARGAV